MDETFPGLATTYLIVGTEHGSKLSTLLAVNGTQTLPVLGCTQNGDFNK